MLAAITDAVAAVNATLSNPEQIKRWSVLPRDLTIDAGEITPTLKIVRPAVSAHFADRIDALYRDTVPPATPAPPATRVAPATPGLPATPDTG